MAIKLITILNRRNKIFEVSDRKPLLQELREQGVDLPYGCEYGGCITCAAKLIDGEVDQRSEHGKPQDLEMPENSSGGDGMAGLGLASDNELEHGPDDDEDCD